MTPNSFSSVSPRAQDWPRTRQRNTVLSVVMTFVVFLLVAQLWFLTQSVDGTLAGESDLTVVAACASGLCFLGVWRLWQAM